MKNLLIIGLCLIIVVCAGCSKKEENMPENMDHKGMKMPMDKDKNNE